MSAKAGRAKGVAEAETPCDQVTYEEIEARAYEIHVSGSGGSEVENWLRAEEELAAERQAAQALESAHEVALSAQAAA